MKILLPLDLTQPVEPIIASLGAFLNLANCDVKLLYVHELLPAYENALRSSGQFSDDWERQLDANVREKLTAASKLLEGKAKSAQVELRNGPTGHTIESAARDWKADVTVLVPRHKHGAEKFLTGSVTSKVAQHVPGTVLILRGAPTKLSTVVCGHDGSDASRFALTRACEMFNLAAAGKVVLCHAVDLAEPVKLLGPVEFVSALEQNSLMQGEVYLADGEKALAAGGVKKVDLQLIEDDPAHGVITMAKDSSADLVVIGGQGHSAVQHFMIGSVSHKIATHSTCSVAVVKPSP
jgi:nucleotide-binding universal stress UspA family protein